MIGSDTTKAAIGGGVMILTAILAVRSGRTRPAGEATVEEISPKHDTLHASPRRAVGPRARPRILTGEPVEPEPRRPAPRRALRLIAGMTTLAVAGAVGLIVLVRALVEMFRQIGG